MTRWNMPPDVNVRDISKNRKLDLLWEREATKFCENCEEESCHHQIEICKSASVFEKYFEEILELF